MTSDGKIIYLLTPNKNIGKSLMRETGDEVARISPDSGSHTTVVGLDGRFAYLAGLRSPLLTVVDTSTHQVVRTIGPFSG